METALINLSFYQFSRLGGLSELEARKAWLKSFCREQGLTGTILLAPEGINAMVCGTRAALDTLMAWARENCSAVESAFKESIAPGHPYARMLVKIKKEIIPIGDSSVQPDAHTARRISAVELKAWLDEGREFLLLDTRNEYEIEVGTFAKAQTLKLDHSRNFAERAQSDIQARPAEWKDQPVVTFCTGGIRCEKASAVLLNHGLSEVYQLDGGILRYFETVGGAHFKGNCFVFDERLAVDPALRPVERSADPEQQFGRHKRKENS